MSLIIKGLDMPYSCMVCNLRDDDFCNATGNMVDIWFDDYRSRNKNCPLVKIPTPHGRLIDGDMLLNSFKGAKKLGVDAIKYYVDNAPTILKAEE